MLAEKLIENQKKEIGEITLKSVKSKK